MDAFLPIIPAKRQIPNIWIWRSRNLDPENLGCLTNARSLHLPTIIKFWHTYRARSRKVSAKAFSFSPTPWNFRPAMSQDVREPVFLRSILKGQNTPHGHSHRFPSSSGHAQGCVCCGKMAPGISGCPPRLAGAQMGYTWKGLWLNHPPWVGT